MCVSAGREDNMLCKTHLTSASHSHRHTAPLGRQTKATEKMKWQSRLGGGRECSVKCVMTVKCIITAISDNYKLTELDILYVSWNRDSLNLAPSISEPAVQSLSGAILLDILRFSRELILNLTMKIEEILFWQTNFVILSWLMIEIMIYFKILKIK